MTYVLLLSPISKQILAKSFSQIDGITNLMEKVLIILSRAGLDPPHHTMGRKSALYAFKKDAGHPTY